LESCETWAGGESRRLAVVKSPSLSHRRRGKSADGNNLENTLDEGLNKPRYAGANLGHPPDFAAQETWATRRIMKNAGLISLLCSVVILGVFFATLELHRSYSHGLELLTKVVLWVSLATSLAAVVRNAGRRMALVALFVNLAGLGAIASIVEHL
jgi:hypothetical protein